MAPPREKEGELIKPSQVLSGYAQGKLWLGREGSNLHGQSNSLLLYQLSYIPILMAHG
jgi:hypothetical protein